MQHLPGLTTVETKIVPVIVFFANCANSTCNNIDGLFDEKFRVKRKKCFFLLLRRISRIVEEDTYEYL